MNQAGQLQLCAVMLAEARLVGRKKGEDVFAEAGVNYFFLYFGSYGKEGDGAIVCWEVLAPFLWMGNTVASFQSWGISPV